MVSVYTEGDECKKCYSCVRSCPTKAIEVHDGKANIIESLCVSCGYCVATCSQGAKRIRSSVNEVLGILRKTDKVPKYAMLAPSFPAAFLDVETGRIVGALREVGFDGVFEVAFGADLVSYKYHNRYKHLINADKTDFIITSPCPAVVSYVEKIVPELVPMLADIASPMEAMALVIREKISRDASIVFIGPCVAKKDEADSSDLVNAVLTYEELLELFNRSELELSSAPLSEFDEPRANLGKIYPVTGGLLKAAAIDSDLLESPVYVVEGKERVVDILNVLKDSVREGKGVNYKLFDLLFCEGCIGGPVMLNDLTFYERKKYIVEYMKQRPLIGDLDEWAEMNSNYLNIDLSRKFKGYRREEPVPPESEIKKILAKTNKFKPEDELNCRACGYSSCREKAIAVYRGKAEVEMCLPYLISKLEETIDNFRENQARLIQAEKLASMGQMAAGIAHEINNPLGVVLMYSHLLKEEMGRENPYLEDVERILNETERTRNIVRGILNFAREEKIERRETDINRLLKTALEDVIGQKETEMFSVEFKPDNSLKVQMVDGNQLKQVFDNIIKNAVEAMPDGGKITLETKNCKTDFSVIISDTGPGIAEEHFPKLFSPFFTTKPVGKGTGLGLPVCYGIVKMHGGTIRAENNKDGGARFIITIKQYIKGEGDA